MSPSLLRQPSFWLQFVFALAAGMFTLRMGVHYFFGPQCWTQGDWLINSEAFLVRRGSIGSALIFISDRTGINLLACLIGLQLAVSLAVLDLTRRAALRLTVTPRLLLLLITPSFFAIYWFYDIEGGFRKEVLAFLSFALLAYGASRGGRLPVWTLVGSMLIYVIAILGHEAMIFLAPAYLLALHVAWGNLLERKLPLAIFLGATMGAFALNLLPAKPLDWQPICEALTSRGLSPRICNCAIAYTTRELATEMEAARQMFTPVQTLGLFYAFLSVITPFGIYLYSGRQTNWRLLAALVIMAVPFLPLFFVAVDWGRWVSMYGTSTVFLLMILRSRGLAPEGNFPFPRWLFVVLAILPLFFTFRHIATRPHVPIVHIAGQAKFLLNRLQKVKERPPAPTN